MTPSNAKLFLELSRDEHMSSRHLHAFMMRLRNEGALNGA